MTEREARGVRLLRAAVATLVVIALGSSAHQAGGGPAPQAIPVLVLAVVVGPLVWVIVRSRASVLRMALATALGQVATHVLLAGMSPSPAGGAATGLHLHETLAPHVVGPSPTATSHPAWSMLVAHAAATVLAAVILTAGDDVLRAATRRLLTAPPSPPVTVGHLALPVESAPGSLAGREVRPVGGRAPPLHAC